ncbi:hypothetical protein ACQUQU_05845 [Thalassolituus sp. LLYu03]|uniref:hypothetical protein n=1 Tax=Thalassolituus sp. LLYu03 TaxID=3421656 RepID=UPI003D2D9DDC
MKHYSLPFLAVLLTACGGGSSGGSSGGDNGGDKGGGETPAPVINVSGISGISYQIGERSGVVQTSVGIPYTAGEQISFKLGNLTLATVDAKESIAVAELFPALPETARDMRAQLRLAYDLNDKRLSMPNALKEFSVSGVPELHRTSNLMLLLVAMDYDADPANGLDLLSGNWATKLADFNEDTLPLNIDLRDFVTHYRTQAFSQTHNLPMAMDIATPLVSLYQLAGISIEAKPLTNYDTVNVTPPTNGEIAFNSDMQVAQIKEVTTNTRTTQYTYDSAGHVTRELRETDLGNNDSIDSSREYIRTYSVFGALSTLDWKDRDINGDLTRHSRKETAALNDALLATRTVSTDQLDNTADYSVDEFSYNTSGLMTQRDYLEYDSSDALLNEQPRARYQYEQDVLTQWTDYAYSGSDLSTTTTQTYTTSVDAGTRVTTVEGVYRNASNEVLGESYRYAETFTDGRLTQADYTQFSGDIGSSVIATKAIVYEYDTQGRLASCTWQDQDGRKGRKRYVYGQYGVLNEITGETYDSELSAFQDDGEDRLFTYGDDGELTFESSFSMGFTYGDENAADGVAYLIHELQVLDNQVGRSNDSCYFFWF